MTIIVYRDGIMAADSLELYDNLRVKAPAVKLWRLKSGAVYGGCGYSSDIIAVKDWLDGGREGEAPNVDGSFASIWAVSTKEVYEIGSRLHPYLAVAIKGSIFGAVGCSEPYAIGMLLAGLSAKEVVKALVKYDYRLSGPVQTMKVRNANS